jgi:hypothetical protein
VLQVILRPSNKKPDNSHRYSIATELKKLQADTIFVPMLFKNSCHISGFYSAFIAILKKTTTNVFGLI